MKRWRKKEKSLFFEFFTVLVLAVFGFYFFYSGVKLFKEGSEIKKKNLKLKEELEKEQLKKNELQRKFQEIQQESFWEEKARERGYKKVGEEQYMIYPSP